MTSKGPKLKVDHDTRPRRPKALDVSKEPKRSKSHWDHVLEEMVWLSKDFESERKWKLTQAKRVALRATKCMVDQATKEERKIKEEEQRLRKVALNISKDIKKFWMKIEKLVLYKHQLEIEHKKKKALDKQLEFLLGQTERYSTMLAENLGEPFSHKSLELKHTTEIIDIQPVEENECGACENTHLVTEPQVPADIDESNVDEGFNVKSDDGLMSSEKETDEEFDLHSDDDLVDDERTVDEDEALITNEDRQEELAALRREVDLPIEELLKNYTCTAVTENVPETEDEASAGLSHESDQHSSGKGKIVPDVFAGDGRSQVENSSRVSELNQHSSDADSYFGSSSGSSGESDEQMLYDSSDGIDDETTLSEEERMARNEPNSDEVELLLKETDMPLEDLLSRYKQVHGPGEAVDDGSPACLTSEESPRAVPKPELNDSENRIADAAAAARSAQPTGNTFSTTKVRTKFPFLLKFPLREYQHIGLDWLVTMYEKRLNGILADEMGLGKTIMTIALLAHLACDKGIWGPHLIVVPTSVMLNWETEFLKWCPAFKILTYFGSAKERRLKRQGWLKPNFFHVCITTYRLIIQDSKVFKRKKWKYLILDEAHLIKNWKSQRWQTLLNFNSKRRVLLTGTPLQNDLMELWSLMHFLMPHVFQSHQEFKDWFCNPISGMVEGQEVNREVVDRLHNVLRPFILRRLKRDVEKQLPMKHEHVVYCRLSRRQCKLYEDFIASSETQTTLSSGSFFGMISVIMQLRKVCNHPDLFEGRPIVSSYDMPGIEQHLSSLVCSVLSPPPSPFSVLGFLFAHIDFTTTSWEGSVAEEAIVAPPQYDSGDLEFWKPPGCSSTNIFKEIRRAIYEERVRESRERAISFAWWNSLRCRRKREPVYSTGLRLLVTVRFDEPPFISNAVMIMSPVDRFHAMMDHVVSFTFAIPAARAPPPTYWCSRGCDAVRSHAEFKQRCSESLLPLLFPFRPAIVRRQLYFPDRRLVQFDCGKLQELAVLLRRLKLEGHRALIFTQMTKMLDVLESFINIYGYTYMRLDGSTAPEERQTLMQRFNASPKYFLFILSTRSGGVGINLVGADTVVFYDSDWNPAMDQQAQDRCHRIGQTREVHIYRLISESTIEENILKKAKQKRALDDLVIQGGGYNVEFFKKLDPMELLRAEDVAVGESEEAAGAVSPSNADVEAALKFAEDEADYMALKKVEEEEEVENQEFTEEAIGRPEDGDEPDHPSVNESDVGDAGKEDDADVGMVQAIVSLESQLRPIDQYAVRFLETWYPLIDKTSLDAAITTEWEMDWMEKLKEADVDDDDEEPLLYEKWDADFATEAYRQQVEALAQHQLVETETIDIDASTKRKRPADAKKKKKKKRSLNNKQHPVKLRMKRHRSPSPDSPDAVDDDRFNDVDGDDDDDVPPVSKRKRKNDRVSRTKRVPDVGDPEPALPPIDRTGGGKISVVPMTGTSAVVIKPEKASRKRAGLWWSRDCCFVPLPDAWCSREDAVLCAVVHEYGPQWNLASETLYWIAAGGSYRGRYRHPVHCCERFRDLVHRHILSPSVDSSSSAAAATKALVKVSERNVRTLLDVAADAPDKELLLQRHFTALLTSVWRSGRDGTGRRGRCRDTARRVSGSHSSAGCRKLVADVITAAAAATVSSRPSAVDRGRVHPVDTLELTVDFAGDDAVDGLPLPLVIRLSVPSEDAVDDQVQKPEIRTRHPVSPLFSAGGDVKARKLKAKKVKKSAAVDFSTESLFHWLALPSMYDDADDRGAISDLENSLWLLRTDEEDYWFRSTEEQHLSLTPFSSALDGRRNVLDDIDFAAILFP